MPDVSLNLVVERVLLSALREQDATLRAELALERARFLADASLRFGASLDLDLLYDALGALSLPEMDAWRIVDALEPDGALRRLAVMHGDPARQEEARRLVGERAPSPTDAIGVPAVTARRRPVLLSGSALLVTGHGEAARKVRAGGPGTVLVVPLVAHEVLFGAVTYVSADGCTPFTPADVDTALDLATRCAQGLEVARAFAVSRAAVAAAERANRVKDEFLGMISHELRSPLAGVAANLQLLLIESLGPLSGRQRDAVHRALQGEEHLLALIEKLLQARRMSAGHVPLELEELQAGDVIAAAAALFEGEFERADLRLRLDLSRANHIVRTDTGKLKQIVINLLSNAGKYTPAGGEVTLTAVVEHGALRVDVTDTGIGVGADDVESVFHPFFRVRDGRQPTITGTGLGLSISRDLARALGGDLTLVSELDQGSVFTLLLPSR